MHYLKISLAVLGFFFGVLVVIYAMHAEGHRRTHNLIQGYAAIIIAMLMLSS